MEPENLKKLSTAKQSKKIRPLRLVILLAIMAILLTVFLSLRSEQLNSDLQIAVQMSDEKKVKDLLSWGADANRLVSRSRGAPTNFWELIDHVLHPEKSLASTKSILVIACTVGNPNIVRELLAHGADKGYISIDGRTPLHYAANKQNSKVLDVLLEKGCKPDVKDKKGRRQSTMRR